jgi:predicted transposase YdaD
MQIYDVTLKLLLQGHASLTMIELAGAAVEKWLNVELPKVQNPRADLLGETADGSLVHVELQSRNDATMPLRMAEYCLGILRLFGKFPRQVLLYVGEAPLGMESELLGPDVSFRYRVVDIRELDGDRLLESHETGDNVIAILARLRDHETAVRKILGNLAGLPTSEREMAFEQLVILSGLRRLEDTVIREIKEMPVYIDLMENTIIGPAIRKGLEQGELMGELKGELKGELRILHRLIEQRFGPIPPWAGEQLAGRSADELEELTERLLKVPSIEDLLR